eukprot:NODE_47_length_2431_cov_245.536195.p3 GENE.NODE_47_length_2431_cov_245.536195~~NODE_47_length_2431_cov_245.536195.p3  ORF type:complete len:147 (-),score=16.50 NODE_47_length_2431_cov_245.536195:658-1098(-)
MIAELGPAPGCRRCDGMMRRFRILAPLHEARCRESFRRHLSRSGKGRRTLDNASARLRPDAGREEPREQEEPRAKGAGEEAGMDAGRDAEEEESTPMLEDPDDQEHEVLTEVVSVEDEDEDMRDMLAVDCVELYSPARVNQHMSQY